MHAVVGTGDILDERSVSREGCAAPDAAVTLDRSAVASSGERPKAKWQTDSAESDVWALALGRALVAFSRIEYAASLMIRQCVPDGFGHKAARLDLSARLVYTERVLRQCGLTNQEEVRWRQVCRSIEALRSQYPAMVAYGAPLPGPIEFTGRCVVVRAARSAQQSLLTLDQIQITAARIAAVHAQFVEATTEILTRLAAEDRLPVPFPPTVPDRV